MKKFLKKHIFVRPTHFDHNTLLSWFCGIMVMFAPFTSCGPSKAELVAHEKSGEVWNNKTEKWEKPNNIYDIQQLQNTNDDIQVRVVDSCEYIIWKDNIRSGMGGICHKANCRNPIHQNKN